MSKYYPSNARYERENLLKVTVSLNRRTEQALVERVEREENRAGFIKRLVREQIAREEGEKA